MRTQVIRLSVQYSMVLLTVLVILSHSHRYSPANRTTAHSLLLTHADTLQQASLYIHAIHPGSPVFALPTDPSYTLVVQSADRAFPYINLFFYSLLAFNPFPDLDRVSIHIVNANNSVLHPNSIYRQMPGLHIVDRNISLDTSILESYFRDQQLQFIAALDVCINVDSPWCVIFEDDAMLSRNFISKLDKLLPPPKSHPITVKFFKSDKFQGFGLPLHKLLFEIWFLPSLTSFAGFLLFAALRQLKFNRNELLLSACIVSAFAVLTAYLCGRQYLISLFASTTPKLYKEYRAAYNLGLAISNNAVKNLRNYLIDTNKNIPIDLLVAEWLVNEGEFYTVNPSIVQHMGLVSSQPGLKPEFNLQSRQDSRFVF